MTLPRLADYQARWTEKQWQAHVIEVARLYGWMAYHTYRSTRSAPGFPDLVLVRDRVVFAELKVGRGRLTTAQARWRDMLLGAGAEWYVWRPEKHLDEIHHILMREEDRLRQVAVEEEG